MRSQIPFKDVLDIFLWSGRSLGMSYRLLGVAGVNYQPTISAKVLLKLSTRLSTPPLETSFRQS